MSWRLLACLIGASLMSFDAGLAQQAASAWPTKQVRLIVPYPAGGPTDLIARLLSQKLGERFASQTFVVENVAGASGAIGAGRVAQSAPDGHTLLVATNDFAVASVTTANLPYDPVAQFVAVSIVATSPQVIAVHASVPATSIKELVELVRAAPDKYSYASMGIGYGQLSAVRLFQLGLKLDKLARVPFNGAAPAIDSTLGGHTQIIYMGLPPAAPQISAGKLRALGVTSAARTKAFPQIPTLTEQGLSDQETELLIGVIAPAGTPADVVSLLHKQIAAIVALPDVASTLSMISFQPVASTPAEFAAQIKSDIAVWSKVMKDAGIAAN